MSVNISGVLVKGSSETCVVPQRFKKKKKKELLNNHFLSYLAECWLQAVNR